MHEAAEADADAIEAGALGQRAVLAERRDANDDEAWIEIDRRDVPALERARPEVLDHDVGGGGQAAEQVLALRLAQVERDALAAAPFDGPEQRVAVFERADLAHEVAGAGLLDLDDVGTHLAEQTRAERRRDARAEIEHAQPFERPTHLGSPKTRSPMMLRWISLVPAKIDDDW